MDNKNQPQIVVARYKEDIDWLYCLGLPYIIYNKGEDIDVPCIKLPNIGREAHSYLYHIVANYENLSNYTLFLQGYPYDHFPRIRKFILNFPNSINTTKEYSKGCYGLARREWEEDITQCHKVKVFPEEIDRIFFKIHLNKYFYAGGAQYLVHKNNIINKPKQFYFDLLNYHKWDGHEAWSFERLWPMIFDKNDKYGHVLKNLGK
jgi:hypothetical protein